MKNILKVSKWEIQRNLKNKSFIIGLFLTPILFLAFFFIPDLLSNLSEDNETMTLHINDEINITNEFQSTLEEHHLSHWEIIETDVEKSNIENLLEQDNTAYIHLTDSIVEDEIIPIYVSENIGQQFINEFYLFEQIIKQHQMMSSGFTEEQLALVSQQVTFDPITISEQEDVTGTTDTTADSDDIFLNRLIPGLFSAIILFSILISGMMIFQSASQEKKEKISEIILSSITPNELMQGKIIGYFILGIVQVAVWLGIALPVVIWKANMPIIKHLFVPELIIFLLIALLGYLLFAALFVGIGATIEDVSTSGNFQGLVLMLPFLPIVFMGPVFSDPNGIVAKVASFVPITSPAILIMRLSILEQWPWLEILLAILVLIITVWLFMKLAGKVFKIGILLYGKNATPKEIWKWLWS